MVQGYVVGWGQQDELGPLALKREIRELDKKADAAQRETANAEDEMARLLDRAPGSSECRCSGRAAGDA